MKVIGTFLLVVLFQLANAQKVYEIVCSSFTNGKSLSNVIYKLSLDDKQVVNINSKNGGFQFAIQNGDGVYALEITKVGYVGKRVYLIPADYPFSTEYEIQEIDLEFVKNSNDEEIFQEGQLKWDEKDDVFNVVKIDAAPIIKKSELNDTEQLNSIYTHAIIFGDQRFEEKNYKDARSHYEIALIAMPKNDYAQEKIEEIDAIIEKESPADAGISKELLDKINKGEISTFTADEVADNILYSVQLGAFSKSINEEKFKNVPDFKIVQYEDFARCFSGEFKNVNDAISRKSEMNKLGYKDAWIVKMKGNQRIEF